MVIHKLGLSQFRNYSNIEIEFHPKINFIYGKNGQGKTNLIESIYFLTHLRSFRTSKLKDLCHVTQDQSLIQANLEKNGVVHEVRINLWNEMKKVFLDQKSVPLSSDYIKNFYSILFAPDLLTAFKEFPLERRNFFDRILTFVNQPYFKKLKDFNKIKKQKNILLRQKKDKEVDVWNKMLSQVIPDIITARTQLIETINKTVQDIFTHLTDNNKNLTLNYKSDLESKTEITSEAILEFLFNKKKQEMEKGFMLYGPQKDSFWMTIQNKGNIMEFSQGEFRISFLALQLAVHRIINQKLHCDPILLLDDVFSELDEQVYRLTMDFISENSSQVFITSTTLPGYITKQGKPIQISNGCISN